MKYPMTLLLLAVMSTPLMTFAEGEKTSLNDKQLNKMQSRLELSDDQMTEMREIRDDGGTKQEIRAVLNDEQKAKAKELRSQSQEKASKAKKKKKKEPKNSGNA